MARTPRLRSRRQRITLAVAALAIVGACFTGEVEFRPTGLAHDALWGAGIVVYALLLNAALGPVLDWRDSHRLADVSESSERRRTARL